MPIHKFRIDRTDAQRQRRTLRRTEHHPENLFDPLCPRPLLKKEKHQTLCEVYKNIYPIKWQDNQSGVLLTPSWDLLYTNGCLWLKRELFFQLECSLNHFGCCSKNSKCVFTKYLRHFEKVLRTIPQSKTSRQFA